MSISLKHKADGSVETPTNADQTQLFVGVDGLVKTKNSAGTVAVLANGAALAAADEPPAAVAAAGSPAVGTSAKAAHADHVHALPVATTSSAGAMSAADKLKLTGIATSATNTPLASTAPNAVGTANVGTSGTAARSDHIHAHGTQAGGDLHLVADANGAGFMSVAHVNKLAGIQDGASTTPLSSATPSPIGTAAPGSSGSAARADHVHAYTLPLASAKGAAVIVGAPAAGVIGTSGNVAREDHQHALALATTSTDGALSSADKTKLDNIASSATNTPLSSSVSGDASAAIGTTALGTGTRAARWDHVHAHGNQGAGDSFHIVADASNNGFMSKTQAAKLAGITDNATSTPLTSTTPSDLGTAAVGNSTQAARANHVHAHGNLAGGPLHAAADTTTHGFMSATDKARLNATQLGLSQVASGAAILVSVSNLSMTASAPTVDGLTQPVSSTRFYLLTRQSSDPVSPVNGLYQCVVSAPGVATWTRLLTEAQYQAGILIPATAGNTYAGSLWSVCMTGTTPGTLGTAGIEAKQLTAAATVSSSGLLSAADKSKLDGLPSALLTNTTPSPLGTAAVGNASEAARANHVHAHGDQTSGSSMHQAATLSTNGFMTTTQVATLTTLASDSLSLVVMSPMIAAVYNQVLPAMIQTDNYHPSETEGFNVLLTGQTNPIENGLYRCSGQQLTRHPSYPAGAVINQKLAYRLTHGNYFRNSVWMMTSTVPCTIGTTAQTYEIASGDCLSQIYYSGNAGIDFNGKRVIGVAAPIAGGDVTTKDYVDARTNPLAAGQASTLGRVTVDAILETPTTVTYAASVNLDCSIKNDFAIQLGAGNLAITFTNPASGRQGSIWVRQDSIGSRTVSFAASGYSTIREVSQSDTNPQTPANSVTLYSYQMVNLGGTNYLIISKAYYA